MNYRFKAALSGVAGGAVALGVAELVHGLYTLVPSLPVAVSQRVIELTPGGLATEAIGTMGQAATPVLVAVVLLATMLVCGLLAILSRRSTLLALAGAVALGALGLVAAFSEPSISVPVTLITIVGALLAGVTVAGALLDRAGDASGVAASGDASTETAQTPQQTEMAGTRRRDSGPGREIALGRRGFLALSGGAIAGGLAAAGAGRLLSGGDSQVASSGGAGQSLSGGSASGGVSVDRLSPPPDSASIDVPGMPKLITPSDDFYLIDTAISSPRIDRDQWTLSISGDEVSNPIKLSYDELLSFSQLEADVTMSCVSNEVGGGLVSHGRWTGVLLSDVLEEAGIRRDNIGGASEQLVGRAVDGWEAGFRTDIAFDGREAMVVFGLNGEELPAQHGYPVRLVVPGLYGYISATKWLSEIELRSWDYDVYWIKRGWSKTGPVKTQSRIDTVSDGDEREAGTIPIGGVAWAPTRGIQRVEVSTDGGESWSDARLATQLDVDAWRQYVYEWEAEPGEYTIQVRATDGEGETQTSDRAEPIPSGATGYHTMDVTVV
ncbi:MAG: molybdopterin-dependent oxidoreductase [Rubrobacter sp.]|nr:molybdopterin-dependent oxidoreductase [Rubrobacter sp.]